MTILGHVAILAMMLGVASRYRLRSYAPPDGKMSGSAS